VHALFLEGGDLAAVAAIDDVDLRVGLDLAHEPYAARAQDAAIAVQHQRRAEVDVGPHALAVEHAPRELHPALVRAEAVGEILERALAALVADRAVERVVDQQELEHAGARLDDVRVWVDTTMPSATGVEQDVCSFGIFSILTMQTRQEPSMPRPG
jgi:hypothetical protein